MFSYFVCNDRKKEIRDLMSAVVHGVFNRTKNSKVNLQLYCVMRNITKI